MAYVDDVLMIPFWLEGIGCIWIRILGEDSTLQKHASSDGDIRRQHVCFGCIPFMLALDAHVCEFTAHSVHTSLARLLLLDTY